MKLFYTDHFELPLPAEHRFPMAKYRRLRERVLASPWARCCELHVPDAATDEQLGLVHSADYVQRVVAGRLTREEVRRIGFPWSAELVERSRRSVGATIAAARAALVDGLAVNLAGGTHHAFAEYGEGFCVFNDVAVAARVVQQKVKEKGVRNRFPERPGGYCAQNAPDPVSPRASRALVVDCDVHQGNGTAAIFSDDPSVFTFSIHAARNFPRRKHPSDVDIALPDGTGDDAYLRALEIGLTHALAIADADIVFYLAGADPFEGDRLGRMKLTKAGLQERDRLVLAACRQRDLPVAVTMAGGYAREIDHIVDIHAATIRTAIEIGSPECCRAP